MQARKTGVLIPDFKINLLNGGQWHSRSQPQGWLTLLTVYRGMWCSHCKHQLLALERLREEFSQRGVDVVAVSADTKERAGAMVADYGLHHLRIGYDMPIETARQLGLFISKKEKEIEMPLFCEPGSF